MRAVRLEGGGGFDAEKTQQDARWVYRGYGLFAVASLLPVFLAGYLPPQVFGLPLLSLYLSACFLGISLTTIVAYRRLFRFWNGETQEKY